MGERGNDREADESHKRLRLHPPPPAPNLVWGKNPPGHKPAGSRSALVSIHHRLPSPAPQPHTAKAASDRLTRTRQRLPRLPTPFTRTLATPRPNPPFVFGLFLLLLLLLALSARAAEPVSKSRCPKMRLRSESKEHDVAEKNRQSQCLRPPLFWKVNNLNVCAVWVWRAPPPLPVPWATGAWTDREPSGSPKSDGSSSWAFLPPPQPGYPGAGSGARAPQSPPAPQKVML
ncbi:hypothetical protein SKAU_G00355880 [Synaphobranchus kaupii]|uniref:Uncharacterized protein n=1 Tax=Synaphobranchus kaupii TaxID=118154 RepID=A0A9Q1EHC9_SYNKA|nr:hypothetical protein SKAU_G00355880 [Synaphobranchus kaupii]